MAEKTWIILSTVDDENRAGELASGSVRSGLAACAQVEAPILSHYIWKGQPETTREWRIAFKTASSRRDELMAWIRKHHPYKVPEILGWEAGIVDPDYAEWIEKT